MKKADKLTGKVITLFIQSLDNNDADLDVRLVSVHKNHKQGSVKFEETMYDYKYRNDKFKAYTYTFKLSDITEYNHKICLVRCIDTVENIMVTIENEQGVQYNKVVNTSSKNDITELFTIRKCYTNRPASYWYEIVA